MPLPIIFSRNKIVKSRVYIRGKAIICSLGEVIEDIIAGVKEKHVHVDDIPFNHVQLPYTRPYYRIQGDRRGTAEKFFYDILFDTIGNALGDSGLADREIENLAVFFGSTSIDIPIYESYYEQSDSNGTMYFSNASLGYGSIIAEVAKRFGINGPCYTFTTACTSSANAILYATQMIERGMIERAVVIGYDLFNNTGFYGFEALKLMSPTYYKPFDKYRDGIIMGEGCGVLILDSKKGNDGDFYMLGGSNLCDTFNVTSHTIEGNFIAEVIGQAMVNAGIEASDVDAIKAHATGSDSNDRTECNGMKLAFKSALPPVTCIKPYVGHTVGASGAIELIIVTEAVKRGFLPATPGFQTRDEELGITPVMENLSMDKSVLMLNYFGFGGNCTSLVVSNKD